jgi:hypothetical protein
VTTLRPWLIRLMAALLLLQSGAAMAHCLRGMAAAGELIEICAADGIRHVRVDAEGQEIPGDAPAHQGFCAACHALPQVALPEPSGVSAPVAYAACAAWHAAEARALRPAARAPPFHPTGPPSAA